MADIVTTPATETTPAAPVAAITSPAPATATTGEAAPAEQQNAFQKFLASLMGSGKDAPDEAKGAAAGEKPDPAKVTPAPAQGKSYTEEDFKAALEAQKSEWETNRKEQERLAKLDPAERAKAESESVNKKVSDLQAQLLRRDLKDDALKQLEKSGFPTGLSDMIDYTDKDSMTKSLIAVQEMFKSSLELALKEKVRGKTPAGLGSAGKTENSMRDEIARNIRGGLM